VTCVVINDIGGSGLKLIQKRPVNKVHKCFLKKLWMVVCLSFCILHLWNKWVEVSEVC